MAVCPFIEPEIKKEQLYIDIWNPSKMAFMDMMSKYYDSQRRSALFICQDSPDITLDGTFTNATVEGLSSNAVCITATFSISLSIKII